MHNPVRPLRRGITSSAAFFTEQPVAALCATAGTCGLAWIGGSRVRTLIGDDHVHASITAMLASSIMVMAWLVLLLAAVAALFAARIASMAMLAGGSLVDGAAFAGFQGHPIASMAQSPLAIMVVLVALFVFGAAMQGVMNAASRPTAHLARNVAPDEEVDVGCPRQVRKK